MPENKQPDFINLQRQFTAFIRDPEHQPCPKNIALDRISVYQELIFNNISSVLSCAFPVLYSIYSSEDWQALVRDFFVKHTSHSPYFTGIPEEFLAFIDNERDSENDPPFLYELAHYEWVELALDIDDAKIENIPVNQQTNLLTESPVISPLAWLLQYHFPVHKIGKDYLPTTPGSEPFYIIVYRNRNDEVKFLEVNNVTARLINILQDNNEITGEQALTKIVQEMQHPNPDIVKTGGRETLQQLASLDIILGSL